MQSSKKIIEKTPSTNSSEEQATFRFAELKIKDAKVITIFTDQDAHLNALRRLIRRFVERFPEKYPGLKPTECCIAYHYSKYHLMPSGGFQFEKFKVLMVDAHLFSTVMLGSGCKFVTSFAIDQQRLKLLEEAYDNDDKTKCNQIKNISRRFKTMFDLVSKSNAAIKNTLPPNVNTNPVNLNNNNANLTSMPAENTLTMRPIIASSTASLPIDTSNSNNNNNNNVDNLSERHHTAAQNSNVQIPTFTTFHHASQITQPNTQVISQPSLFEIAANVPSQIVNTDNRPTYFIFQTSDEPTYVIVPAESQMSYFVQYPDFSNMGYPTYSSNTLDIRSGLSAQAPMFTTMENENNNNCNNNSVNSPINATVACTTQHYLQGYESILIKMVRQTSPVMQIPGETKRYYADNPADIKQFEEEEKNKRNIVYSMDVNKKFTNQVYIAHNYVLKNEFGVQATKDFPKGTKFGIYYGSRSKNKPTSAYLCEVPCENSGTEWIDAQKFQDFTARINHQSTPNLSIKLRRYKNGDVHFDKNGQANIIITAIRDIKKDDIIGYDYRPPFWLEQNIKPLALHSSDNDIPDELRYMAAQRYYAIGTYQFNESIRNLLQLPDLEHVVPKIFFMILNRDIKSLEQIISEGYPVEIVDYACNGDQMSPIMQQQHLTPLQFACALGDAEIIKILLKSDADITRCLLVSGESPLTLLLKSKASAKIKNEIGSMLIDIGVKTNSIPFAISYFDYRSALHYAIEQALNDLVEKILSSANKIGYDLLELLYIDRNHYKLPEHAGFDFCLKHANFEIMKFLLDYAMRDMNEFHEAINNGIIFNQSTLKKVDNENLKLFLSLLKKINYDKYIKKDSKINLMKIIETSLEKNINISISHFSHFNNISNANDDNDNNQGFKPFKRKKF